MARQLMFHTSLKGLITPRPPSLFPNPNTSFKLNSKTPSSIFSSKINPKFLQTSTSMENTYSFGPYKIDEKEVFYSTKFSYAMVNLRPVVPGHVLICPKREVKRFIDLHPYETTDLWMTAQKVGGKLENYHNASSLTLTIQDGPHAGQTVPHVHIHILPRKSGDFEKNDEIYDVLDEKEAELKQKLDLDKERKDRTFDEMAQEAEEYRKLFL